MLGPGPGGMKLPGAGGSLRIAARRPAIEDWFAALQAGTRRRLRGRRGCGHNRSFVNRARTGLGHHHAPCRRRRRRRRGRRLDARRRRGFRFCHRGCSCGRRLRRSRGSHGNGRRCRLLNDNRSRRRHLRHRRLRGHHRGRNGRGSRFDRCRRLFRDVRMLLMRDGCRRRLARSGGLDDNNMMRRSRRRTGRCNRGCRGLGNHWGRWRMRGDGRRGGRMGNDGRSLPRRGNDLAGLRTRRRSGCGRSSRDNRRGRRGSLWSGCYRGLWRQMAAPRLFLVFLLLGQNGLQDVAGLGDVRQVNFRRDRLPLRSTRRR